MSIESHLIYISSASTQADSLRYKLYATNHLTAATITWEWNEWDWVNFLKGKFKMTNDLMSPNIWNMNSCAEFAGGFYHTFCFCHSLTVSLVTRLLLFFFCTLGWVHGLNVRSTHNGENECRRSESIPFVYIFALGWNNSTTYTTRWESVLALALLVCVGNSLFLFCLLLLLPIFLHSDPLESHK